MPAYSNLPPCPYCGQPVRPWRDYHSSFYNVICGDCGAAGPSETTETRAILAYNNTHPNRITIEAERKERRNANLPTRP